MPQINQSATPRQHFWHRSSSAKLLYTLAYVILAVLIYAPAGPWSNSSIPTGPLSGGLGVADPTLMTWFLTWFTYAVTHGYDIFFTHYLFSWHGTTLYPYTSVPLLGALASPFTLNLGPVAALNILLRVSLAGSATSMFLVLSSWCRRPYAFMGGLLFGFGPYLMTQSQNHVNLTFLPLLPPMVWCVYEIVVVRRRSPVALGLILGLFAALQIYVSLEMITLLGIVLGVGSVGYLFIIRGHIREHFGYWASSFGAAAAIFVVLTGFFVYNFLFGTGHLRGTILPVSALQFFHADLLGPLIPTVNQLVTTPKLSHLSGEFVGGNVTENGTYLGLPLVATLAYFSLRFKSHPKIIGSSILAFIALILSMGDRLTIAGHDLHVVLPEKLLSLLPLVDNIVPARFGAIVTLFAAVALALGTELLVDTRRALGTGLTAPRWVVPGVGLAVVLSLIPSFPVSTTSLTTPPALRSELSAIPVGAEVLTYPFPTYIWSEPMIWQAQDGMRFRLLGGYIRPTYPPLLAPASVQEYFIDAADWFIPPSLLAGPMSKKVAALRQYLLLNHVGAVIFWNTGVNPSTVRDLLDATLGRPTRHAGNKFALWVLASPLHR